MNLNNFSFLVRLPNERPTKIILDEERQGNYISKDIVDLLLQTGEIIVEGDQAFVEFHRQFKGDTLLKSVKYFDEAYYTIDTSTPYIPLGQQWMKERHVEVNFTQSICIIQPPHLPGKFYFPEYVKPMPPKKTVIGEKLLELASKIESTCEESIIAKVLDHALIVESGLALVDDSIFIFDSTFESVTTTKVEDTWDQTLFAKSGLDLIQDNVFEVVLSLEQPFAMLPLGPVWYRDKEGEE